ncbi:tetratricopeptide repeat protein [Vreelandella massiliensis]|uniref:tetratricopeptide repeat protein n=1 Tax=Vreelandella massiliensis TaxID=1816686 RepID=UPI00096A8811|nr:tetratricopeptide repeat protein [Halomonas massiliensis]MYL25046.1 tetratricopeptide repeat protein [Halomonas alkaliantarctica]
MSIIDPRTGEALTAPIDSDDTASAQQSAPAGGGSVRPEDVIIDLDASNIQQVLEASMQVPVLLDCWAPWCEPCKNLMPVLEKLAVEYGGAFLLAKLDVEANPEIAGQLGVRSVPDVKLVSQGGLVDSFQGALPEKEIREWLGRYFQAPADAPPSPEEQAEAALKAGDAATARETYQTLVSQYPEHYAYQVSLAKALVAEGRGEEARSVLDNLPPEERDAAPARGVRASIAFGEQALSHEEIAALGERDDSEAQFQRALRHVADGDYESGLEGLLALMKRDRAYGDDAARKTLLQVFDALGADHPLTVAYRRKLFALLY